MLDKIFCYFLFLFSAFCNAELSECQTNVNCSSCIQTKGCLWCFDPDKGSDFRRCEDILVDSTWCDDKYIVKLMTENKVVTDEPLGIYGSRTVQITPQNIQLKLRIDEMHHFTFKYKQAEDFAVDLYYLMDLSASMEDDKENLVKLGATISKAMRALTSNFHLGFGSFVDKVVLPYVLISPKKLKAPCKLKDKQTECAPAYSFKNHMPLSNDTEQFSHQVKNTPVSGNLDWPEGGFDAVMQAIVCTEKIKWRPNARHLLVFSTDSGFHYAGDGKLAGIVEPNDGICHLNEKGEYTHSLEFDYPSIAQINHKAKEHNINIIFAVTDNVKNVYRDLQQSIEGSSFGIMDQDSANVKDLILQEYQKLVNSVKIDVDAPDFMDTQIFTKCLGKNERQTSQCDGLHSNDTVEFVIYIRAKYCPEDKSKWKHTIEVKPHGVNESLLIDIELLCECSCSKSGQPGYEENSASCSYQGSLDCAVCKCKRGFVGKKCECNEHSTVDINEESCISEKDNITRQICSGYGQCICGKCQCDPRMNPNEEIYGPFCECDNFSCNRIEDRLCNDKGTCKCGKCFCQPGYSDDACQCSESNYTCIHPGKDIVCEEHGSCKCGMCDCDENYSGLYCQDCLTCSENKCSEKRNCIECQAFKTGILKEEECLKCPFTVELVKEIVPPIDNEEKIYCRIADDADCTITFLYNKTEDKEPTRKPIIWVKKDKECITRVNVLLVVLAVAGGILLFGILLLLIWKLVTSIHDSREYARFEKERAKSTWGAGDNPLYKPSISTYNNPTFGKKTS